MAVPLEVYLGISLLFMLTVGTDFSPIQRDDRFDAENRGVVPIRGRARKSITQKYSAVKGAMQDARQCEKQMGDRAHTAEGGSSVGHRPSAPNAIHGGAPPT
ncbi:hypothetical protein AAFF_G00304260 [Aldrovandia affinis]|uniref:Uncharacterized protein n=1 Tax=Aldrovandia affinis TaxID=143900 RepID=A0AAD7SPD4_9TELE|nr:hypothetical protein AAFF_G00304260 [Aldrovandia affinis]